MSEEKREKNSDKRYEICQSCDTFNSFLKTCRKCGCFLPAKVKLASSKCPKGKW